MNDKELADRVVALGVGKKIDSIYYSWGQQAGKFVRDWRVAGALMEEVHSVSTRCSEILGHDRWDVWVHKYSAAPPTKAYDVSLPRAICEACVKALEQDNE